MSTMAIFKTRLTTKVVMTTFASVHAVPPSSDFNERVGILRTPVFPLEEKPAPLCTTLLDWQRPISFGRWEYLALDTLMTVMSDSCVFTRVPTVRILFPTLNSLKWLPWLPVSSCFPWAISLVWRNVFWSPQRLDIFWAIFRLKDWTGVSPPSWENKICRS